LPPTVNIDPISDGHGARYGYRCDAEAATRDSENARSRYALERPSWLGGRFADEGAAP
jgi:hypothetical protein